MLWDDYLFIVKTEKVHDISAKWITPKAWLGSFKPGVLHLLCHFSGFMANCNRRVVTTLSHADLEVERATFAWPLGLQQPN